MSDNWYLWTTYILVIPVGICFIISIVLTSLTVWKVRAQTVTPRAMFRGTSHKRSYMVLTMKMVFVFGIMEGIGFIQIPKTQLTDGERILNVCCAFVHTSLRSVRGVVIFVMFVCHKSVFICYKQLLCTMKTDVERRCTANTEPQVLEIEETSAPVLHNNTALFLIKMWNIEFNLEKGRVVEHSGMLEHDAMF